MEPRPFGRGRSIRKRCRPAAPPASMGPRPFGRGRNAGFYPLRQRRQCFNGAATFRPRKDRRAERYALKDGQLQWGRNLSAAEGSDIHARAKQKDWLQWGRDLSAAEGGMNFLRRVSRWSLQWGRDLSAAEGARHVGRGRCGRGASMGPRPFGRGRLVVLHDRRDGLLLQWGRDLSAAEGGARPLRQR